MEAYFENLPEIGTLYLEYTFYAYGESILFVCVDERKIRYLCSCCKLSENWILVNVSNESLIELIDEHCTIKSLFDKEHIPFMVTWDGNGLSVMHDQKAIYPFLPDDELLDIPAEQTSEYRAILLKQIVHAEKDEYKIISQYIQKIRVFFSQIDNIDNFKMINEPFNCFDNVCFRYNCNISNIVDTMDGFIAPIVGTHNSQTELQCEINIGIQKQTAITQQSVQFESISTLAA